MRRPTAIDIPDFTRHLDVILREQAANHKRAQLPPTLHRLMRKLNFLIKPLLQSGAMALTALAIIIAISAAPAARTGDLVTPIAAPLAAPNAGVLAESDSSFIDYLPVEDLMAVQEADNSDILGGLAE